MRRRALLAGLGALAFGGCRDPGAAPPGRVATALWFSYGGRNREVLEALVARFNRVSERFFVHAVYQGDYFEGLAKLRTAIAAGAAPSLSHVIGEVVPYLAEAGVLEPLGDYPGARELTHELVPELGQSGSWQGGAGRPLVALPFNRSTPIAYLNGEVFRAAGRAAPTTWRELRETARALTSEGRFGFGCPIDWWFWVALVGQAGGRIVEPSGELSLGGAAGAEAIELWQTLVHVDRSMKPPPGRDYNAWEATNQDFLAGRTRMIWTSTAFLKYLEDNASFPVVAAPLPAREQRAVPTGGTHWVIMKSAPAREKQAAWAFLRFMHEPAQVIEWATRTGYLPVTRGAIAELERRGYYRAHPNDRVALDQLAWAMPWPWSAELFRVEREIVQPGLEHAVLARGDARQVIADGARAAREAD